MIVVFMRRPMQKKYAAKAAHGSRASRKDEILVFFLIGRIRNCRKISDTNCAGYFFEVKLLQVKICQLFFYSPLTKRNKQRYAQSVFAPDRQFTAHFIHEYPCDIQT